MPAAASQRVILAADGLDYAPCLDLVEAVGSRTYAIKVHDLVDRKGPDVIAALRENGASRVWVDAKLHDIPHTVGLRARALFQHGANIVTVHASGGIEMMAAAVEEAEEVGGAIFAISVLTSLGEEEAHLTYGQPSKAAVIYFARLAMLAGVHGLVCSPKEVGVLAKLPELRGLSLIVPGIRSAGKDTGDQKRVDTPAAAVKAGASRLVIGRQITQAADPLVALDEIEAEIAAAEEALATEAVSS